LPAQSPPPRFSSSSAPTVLAPVERVSLGDGGEVLAVPGAQLPVPVVDDGDEPKRPRYRQRRRLIADEVEDRLRQAGMLDSWQGAAALDLADSLDWAGGSGAARAALHRELNRAMSELLRGVDESGSKVGAARDELATRRARRGAGA
jgi:hypothetical protein